MKYLKQTNFVKKKAHLLFSSRGLNSVGHWFSHQYGSYGTGIAMAGAHVGRRDHSSKQEARDKLESQDPFQEHTPKSPKDLPAGPIFQRSPLTTLPYWEPNFRHVSFWEALKSHLYHREPSRLQKWRCFLVSPYLMSRPLHCCLVAQLNLGKPKGRGRFQVTFYDSTMHS